MSGDQNSFNPITLLDILHYRANYQPDKIAYTFLVDGESKEVNLTYQELELQARAIASQLQYLKISGRALLVYPYDAGLEFITAFFGCLFAGVVAVPCHPPRNRHGYADLLTRLAGCEAQVVLTTKNLLAKLKSQLKTNDLLWLDTDNISISTASNWLKPEINSDTLAFLQYTSGTTGIPKGVMITHECILQSQQMLKIAFEHTEKAIGVGWLPLFHDMGLIGNVLQALYIGSPCIFMSPITFVQKPVRWLKAISHYKATTSGAPNFAYELLCTHVTDEQIKSLNLSSWDVAFSGAEPIKTATLERFVAKFAPCGFRAEAFYPCYGMAEATLLISGGKKRDLPVIKYVAESALEQNRVIFADNNQEKARSACSSANAFGFAALTLSLVGCGGAWLDEKIIIVDPESLTQCLPNQVGEIWVSGSGIGKGYWHQPEQTICTFQAYLKDTNAGPFLRTGDLGFLDDGELFITGRLHDVMVFWGLNHYPHHIEQTVQECHPGLRKNCGAVFSIEVEGEDKLVVVQEVERNYRDCLVIDDVVAAVRWVVFDQHFVDVYAIALLKPGSIPKTSSGKIQRRLCRDKFLDESLDIISQWRDHQAKQSNITSLLRRYLNPLTHVNRYFKLAQGRLRRVSYLLLGKSSPLE